MQSIKNIEVNVNAENITADLESARNLLKVKVEYTADQVLQFFEVAHWVAVENKTLDKIPSLINAKNVLLRHMVSEQMLKQRYFKIESPFENSCRSCRGTGEIYKFEPQTIEVICRSCGGEGKRWIKCPSCKATGRYKVTWKEGGGIDEPCKRCKAENDHHILVDCYQCNREGSTSVGKKTITVKSHVIKSATPCRFCGGLGFAKNLPFKVTKAYKEESRKRDAIRNPNNHKKIKKKETPLRHKSIGEQLKQQLEAKAQ